MKNIEALPLNKENFRDLYQIINDSIHCTANVKMLNKKKIMKSVSSGITRRRYQKHKRTKKKK